jgi:hypothetical protein
MTGRLRAFRMPKAQEERAARHVWAGSGSYRVGRRHVAPA